MKVRYLEKDIEQVCFVAHKMAFVSGPRQCGKTTMAKRLLRKRGAGSYFNWDEKKFRKIWIKDPSQVIPDLQGNTIPIVILDEIHKAKLWKKNLKGVYDTLENYCDILVTGSSRLNTYRKGSDSLMGRYYHFLLHPFSLAELTQKSDRLYIDDLLPMLLSNNPRPRQDIQDCLHLLEKFGPFPEPFLSQSTRTLNLWQMGRIEKLVREDLRDLSKIPELSQIEMLVSLLPGKVANHLSIRSLSEDLEVAYTTIKRWLKYLQELYYYYEVKPFTKSLPRSVKKMSKIYLWDWSEVENDGARFENLIASHLFKYCSYLTDTGFGKFELRFLRNKEHKEIDFLIIKNNKPWLPIEVKVNEEQLSPNWRFFLKILPCKQGIQILKKPGIYQKITTEYGEVLIISADKFLRYLV